MSTADRKAEIARKKLKLQAMREGKLKKEELRNGTPGLTFKLDPVTSGDADDILKELGIFNHVEFNGKTKLEEITKSASTPSFLAKISTDEHIERKMGIQKISEITILPKEIVSYSKNTQTVSELHCETPSILVDTWMTATPKGNIHSPKGMQSLEWDDDDIEALPYDGVEPVVPGDVSQTLNSNRFFHPETPVRLIPVRELADEDKAEILASDKFFDFFTRASRLMERALDESGDIFFDYSGADRDDDAGKDQELLKFERVFFDERWTANRTITALDWSTAYPELLLSAYHTNELDSHEPDGVCLIWNLKYKKTSPEYIFHHQAAITSAILTEFNPSLVIGGTYGGQIVLWDTRVNKRTTVQCTSLSGQGHAEPISALAVTGSHNAHNLISVSTDGKLCSWSLDMLDQPQQSLELAYRQSRSICATSMAFFPEDSNNFLVGAQDGGVYAGSRHGKQPGIMDHFEGHHMPITAVAIPNVQMPPETPPFFLTTSLDCSVKLWSKKDSFPIFSFDDRSEYVLDCDWSPIHPALFTTVDSNGQLDIWSFNSDHEVPTASSTVEGNVSLNRCKFHKKGSHIAVGDTTGRVRIFDLHEKLAVPRADEWNKISRLVNILSASVSEQREFDFQNYQHRYPMNGIGSHASR